MKKIYGCLYRDFLYRHNSIKGRSTPYTTAVKHENGFLYASQGYILAKIPAEYDKALEGKALNKLGEEVEVRVRYESVIPDYSRVEVLEVDKKLLEQAAKNMYLVKLEGNPALLRLGDDRFKAADVYAAIRLFGTLKKEYVTGIYRFSDGRHNLMFLGDEFIYDNDCPLAFLMPCDTLLEGDTFTIDEAIAYEKPKKVEPENKAWYE